MKKTLLIFVLLLTSNAYSFEKTTNFTFEKFKNAQNSNKTIVINSWNKTCSTCAAQSKIFADALNDFKDVEFLFYEQTKNKDIAKALDIRFWTTIVVFKGKKEVAREIGLIRKEEIYKIIEKGI
tara:strand:+ start:418 stop:789 length:372 start_codon:yes stop_codon:yes gene_type:complete